MSESEAPIADGRPPRRLPPVRLLERAALGAVILACVASAIAYVALEIREPCIDDTADRVAATFLGIVALLAVATVVLALYARAAAQRLPGSRTGNALVVAFTLAGLNVAFWGFALPMSAFRDFGC